MQPRFQELHKLLFLFMYHHEMAKHPTAWASTVTYQDHGFKSNRVNKPLTETFGGEMSQNERFLLFGCLFQVYLSQP